MNCQNAVILTGRGLALACLLACCACGGAKTDSSIASADLPAALPNSTNAFGSPAELLRRASTGPSDSDRYHEGGEYDSGLPQNKISGSGAGDIFLSPEYLPPAGELMENAAFAGFDFGSMDSYSGSPQVTLGWTDTPPALADTFIGVANFAKDSWHWIKPNANWVADFGSYTDRVSVDSRMLVVVLLLGGDEAELDWVLLGDSSLPGGVTLDTDLNADPALNLAGLTVNFEAQLDVFGGTVESYEFDVDGSSGFEITGDTTGLASFTYDTPGMYSAFVTVHTTDGNVAQDGLTFTVVDPANTPPLPGIDVDIAFGDAPLEAQFSAAASTDDGFITNYEWDFDGDGNYEFSSAGTAASYIFGRSGVVDVSLRVTDNDFASASAIMPIEVFAGWHTATIANDVTNLSELCGCVSGSGVNATPCVAWQQYATADLFFASASSGDGSSWNPTVVPGDVNSALVGYGMSMISEANSRPLLVYGENRLDIGEYRLFSIRAQNQSGLLWELPVAVDAAADAGHRTALGKLGTTPIIFSVDGHTQGIGMLTYYRALNDNGTSWGLPQAVAPVPAGSFYSGLSCGGAAGYPLVSYCVSGPSGSNVFGSLVASDVGGLDWDAPDEFSPYLTQGTAFVLADGKPAIAAGDSSQSGALSYLRADDVEGRGWTAAPAELAPANLGGEPSMAMFLGRPCIAYKSFSSSDLWLIQAQDIFGSAWFEPYRVDSLSSVVDEVVLLATDDTLVICYFDSASSTLKAAYFN